MPTPLIPFRPASRRGSRSPSTGFRGSGHCAAILLVALAANIAPPTPARAAGEFTISVVDDESGDLIPVRIVLTRPDGSAVPLRRSTPAGIGAAIDGQMVLKLPPKTYLFEVSRGPEYRHIRGTFTIDRDSEDAQDVRLPRVLRMADEGWFAGDPLLAIPAGDVTPRMQAEALPIAGLVQSMDEAGAPDEPNVGVCPEVYRGTGAATGLASYGLRPILDRSGAGESDATAPSSEFITAWDVAARRLTTSPRPDGAATPEEFPIPTEIAPGCSRPALAILHPFAWDVPIWLASGRIDGVVVLGEFLQLDRPVTTWPDSRRSGKFEFSGPLGLGRWAEEIYLRMIDAGIDVVPLGVSGAGYVPNPVGYNRTYVFLGNEDSPSDALAGRWWDGLWDGASVVTNGPLLRPTLEGQPPGHRFAARQGQTLTLTPELRLTTADPVDYLQVIRDGHVVYNARLDEFAQAGGMIPPLEFQTSGWVVVRVMTKYESHYRAAISAPWHVVFDDRPRVSRSAVAFFQEWLSEREAMLAELPREERARHAPFVRAARAFWQHRAEGAVD